MLKNIQNKRIWALLLGLVLLFNISAAVRADETLPEVGVIVSTTAEESEAATPEETELETLPAEETDEPQTAAGQEEATTSEEAGGKEDMPGTQLSVLDFLKLRSQLYEDRQAVDVITERLDESQSTWNVEEGLLRSLRMRKLAELSELNIIVFRGSGSVNVRSEADAESEILGHIRYNGTATVLDSVYTENGLWYHISSGDIEGYVKAEFFESGYEAADIISGIVTTYATIRNDAQRLYRSADTSSDTVASLESGRKYQVDSRGDYFTRILYAEGAGGAVYGYIPNDYVQLSWELQTAVSIEREKQEAQAANEAIYIMNSLDRSREESIAQSIEDSKAASWAASLEESRQASIAQSLEQVAAESRSREASIAASKEASIRAAESAAASIRASQEAAEHSRRQSEEESRRAQAAQQASTNISNWADLIPAGTSTLRRNIALLALRYVNVLDYRWGYEDLNYGADCSGFLKAVYAQYGIKLEHYSYTIARTGVKVVNLDQAKTGDIICWYTWSTDTGRGHVGMFLGRDANGTAYFIESPTEGQKVRVTAMKWEGFHTIQDVVMD